MAIENGGAIYISGSLDIIIDNSIFSENVALY